MKKHNKRILSFLAIVLLTIAFPLSVFAETHNKSYDGTYTNTNNKMSFIDIDSKECTLYIVYTKEEGTYIKAVVTDFKIDSKEFYAKAKKYIECNENGKSTSGVQTQPTVIRGKVKRKDKKIIITIDGNNYEKKL